MACLAHWQGGLQGKPLAYSTAQHSMANDRTVAHVSDVFGLG